MKSRILIAVFLFASCVYAEAENVYAVPYSETGVSLRDEITLPATLTGRVSSASSATTPHIVEFQVDRSYGLQPAAIYTNTGTGAVFHAELLLEEGNRENISSAKNLPFSSSTTYTLFISASTYKEGASYAVRIGTFGAFSVSFNGNGGRASQASRIYTLGSPYGGFPTATRTNYVFTGWSTAANNGIVVSTNTPVCLGYKTLYAQWKADTTSPTIPTNVTPVVTNYWVKFDSNGGTGTMSNQLFTVGVKQALAPNAFTRSGYEFRGWATSSAGSVVYEDRAIFTNKLAVAGSTNTLYASWIVSSAMISAQNVNGVVWHYTAANGVATIQNVSGGSYVSAVDTSIKGNLVIPETLGSNTVEVIGERAFAGCDAVTSIDIPFGVKTIGSYAFSGCGRLSPGITIPESVETMGSYVFADCISLKIVRYWGNRPEADEALYAGAPSSLVSGALRLRSGWEMQEAEQEPAKDNATGSDASDGATGDAETGSGTGATAGDDSSGKSSTVVWHESLPASWPEGSHARRVFWLTDQPLYKVAFWGVPGINKPASIQYYIPGRAISSLPEEEPEREGYKFLGWFTKQYGGVEVTEENADEFVVDSSFSIYAHWQKEDDPEAISDLEYDFTTSHVYNGYLLNGEGGVAGTIQFKTSRAKWNRKTEETNVTATAAIMLLGEGTVRLKGSLDDSLSGALTPTKSSDERELSVSLTGSAMEGDFDSYVVVGARNVFVGKTYFDHVQSQAADDNWKGTYVVALKAESDGAGLGNGYLPLSVQVNENGKAHVTGVLPDGTKIAYSGQMEVRDGGCVLPVAVPLYSGKKGGLGFLVEFSDDDGVSVASASEWSNTAIPFTSALTAIGAGYSSQVNSGSSFAIEGGFDIEDVEIDESLLPEDVEVTVSGSKWRVPKADRVKFIKDDAAYEVQTEYGNPAGLALSFNAKTGTFRGSFKVFGVTEAGKSKKYTAVINGVVFDGVGYGTATIKKVGAVPVTVNVE